MTTPRLILYAMSMVIAVALIFFGCVQLAFWRFSEGLIQIGLGLIIVLLNSSRVDRV